MDLFNVPISNFIKLKEKGLGLKLLMQSGIKFEINGFSNGFTRL